MTRTGHATMLRAALALGAVTLLPAGTALGADDLARSDAAGVSPGEVLVRYEAGTSSRERAAVRGEVDADLGRRLLLPRVELLELDPSESVEDVVARLERESDVAYAEPNFTYTVASTLPDDGMFQTGALWPLDNAGLGGATEDADIDAPEAWDVTQGSDSVVVGVVDSGVATAHPDLNDNIWANPEEDSGTEGTDDDSPMNGFVDDVKGWDFVEGDNDPTDGEGHGTHVAGTIGAEGNNSLGSTGVNWDVSLMPLRACDNFGVCQADDIADAFVYAGANGAQVVNASLSGSQSALTQAAAIAASPDTLFVVAAGNNQGNDNDSSPRFPCNYESDNLICVGATTDRDNLAGFSNFGSSSVDIAAPGGGSPGLGVVSTYTVDRMAEGFTSALGPNWETGGSPGTWDRTEEVSELPGATLTDSPGGPFANDTDSYARFGPVDLSSDSGCHLRYDLGLDTPDPDDHLEIQASSDDVDYATLQDWTGVGKATFTPSLDAFSGSSTTYIRFHLVSDGADTGDGAHVDNVRIRCPSEGYKPLEGTSMASPHVAGTAALILAEYPAATVADLREWLLEGADAKASLEGKVASGGRLNAARALAGAGGADINRPDTTIVGGPATTSKSTSATFSFVSDEPGTFSCSLNGQAFTTCPSPRSLSGLAIGQHTFRVRAVDLAGNEDASPASYSFNVQAADPNPCAALRKKLRRAKTLKQKRKLRRKIKRHCASKSA